MVSSRLTLPWVSLLFYNDRTLTVHPSRDDSNPRSSVSASDFVHDAARLAI